MGYFELSARAADNGNTSYEKPSPGIVQALCIDIIDGKYSKNTFQGQDRGWRRTVFFLFEINQRYQDGPYKGRRMLVATEYTFSINAKATLRKEVESWIGQKLVEKTKDGITSLCFKVIKNGVEEYVPFDLAMLKDKSCFLCLEDVGQQGRPFIKATKIMPFDKKQYQPLNKETPDGYMPKWMETKLEERFDTIPSVEDVVNKNNESVRAQAVEPAPDDDEEDLPF